MNARKVPAATRADEPPEEPRTAPEPNAYVEVEGTAPTSYTIEFPDGSVVHTIPTSVLATVTAFTEFIQEVESAKQAVRRDEIQGAWDGRRSLSRVLTSLNDLSAGSRTERSR